VQSKQVAFVRGQVKFQTYDWLESLDFKECSSGNRTDTLDRTRNIIVVNFKIYLSQSLRRPSPITGMKGECTIGVTSKNCVSLRIKFSLSLG